jgi:hypothetical protein
METLIAEMLAAAGLSPSEPEVAAMAETYAELRTAVDALYEVPGARYADPALRFRAADTGRADWS